MTRLKLVRIATLGATTLCCVYAALLLNMVWQEAWPVTSGGALTGIDFVPLYAAGRLALDGSAAAAYDWAGLWDVIHALGGQGTVSYTHLRAHET